MRSAQTAARGTIISMKVAIITDHQDLHQVGEEGGQGSDLHRADLDPHGRRTRSRPRWTR